MTILVVDDDLWLRQVAARALRSGGYTVLDACDGPAALAMSAGHPGRIDLVCTDAVMPGMTGAEMVRRLRDARPGLKAVFMSGYGGQDLTTWGVDAARESFIQKPFTARGLLRCVRDRLDARDESPDAAPDSADELDTLRSHPDRLRVLRETGLLDAPPDEHFDRLTRLAVRFLRVPSAYISLLDEQRDFYLSNAGFPEPLASLRTVTQRTICHYALLSPEPLVIDDVAADPVYGGIPIVQAFGVSAYVGVPLVVSGETIGSLSVIDAVARAWTRDDIATLQDLAAVALDEIALRSATRLRQEAVDTLGRANLQLQLAKNTAEAASRTKSEFLAHMSHELRTPLNSIIGFANQLCRNTAKSLGARELMFAERISSNGQHLLTVVNDILDLAKVEEGDLTLRLSWVDLAERARAICSDFSAAGAAAQVSLTVIEEVPDDGSVTPAPLHTDDTKLRQVLMNLIGNALKFTPSGGYVRVNIAYDARSGAPVRLDVTDSGIGIAPGALQRVFEAFEQAEDDTNARFGGTGLGLRISRALCDAMGYGLTVTSEVGVGSTFSIAFTRRH